MKLAEFAEAAAIFAKYDDPTDGLVGARINRACEVEVSINADAEVSAEDMTRLTELGWERFVVNEPSFRQQCFLHDDLIDF